MSGSGKIKLLVKNWHSPDVEPFRWEPEGPAEVRFLLEVDIGEADEKGTNTFEVVIATPCCRAAQSLVQKPISRKLLDARAPPAHHEPETGSPRWLM